MRSRVLFVAQLTWFVLVCRTLDASSIAPGIIGTVYHDLNQDGIVSPGERLGGMPVQLFRDNLDGVFDPNTDLLTGYSMSDALGNYRFENIEGSATYFIRQLANGGFEASVSPLIDPSVPDRLIDGFEGSQRVRVNTPHPSASADDQVDAFGITISSRRSFDVQLISGVGDVVVESNPFDLQSQLLYSTSAGVRGHATITWEFDQLAPGSGLDLTFDGHLAGVMLRASFDQAAAGDQLRLRLVSADGSIISETRVDVPLRDGDESGFVFVPFSQFDGIDPTDVAAVELEIGDRAASVDATFDLVGLLGPKPYDIAARPVPEPSTWSLCLAALFGMLVGRAKRRRNLECGDSSPLLVGNLECGDSSPL